MLHSETVIASQFRSNYRINSSNRVAISVQFIHRRAFILLLGIKAPVRQLIASNLIHNFIYRTVRAVFLLFFRV